MPAKKLDLKKKEPIRIKRVKEIPEELVTKFVENGIGINSSYYTKIKKAPLKIGAFKGEIMVGFMVARKYYGDLWLDAPFVRKEFRRKGIGSKMLFRMFGEAKKRGIEHVGINNTTIKFDVMASRAMSTVRKKEIKSITHKYWEEDLKTYWDFWIRKGKKPGSKRRRI